MEQRFDSIPLHPASFTKEGYLVDNPIVTRMGIFEYHNPDGTVRRELRLPEHIFNEDSLASYEGKPIIVTHDGGFIDRDNVEQEQIGTILSKGYQDGENVRCKIVIHNTEAMERCGLRELSLGYTLDLDFTPGEWQGQPYDAVQTNIRVNHLALVRNARAGGQARLNIDSEDKGGENQMEENKNISDFQPDLTPEELQKAVEEFKQRKAQTDEEKKEPQNPPPAPMTAQEKVQMVKDRRDHRDTEDPQNTIARQDEDIQTLLEVIETLEAQKDFGQAETAADKADGEESKAEQTGNNPMNTDSIDDIVRTRVCLARIGDRLNLDGLDTIGIMEAKKRIIQKVKPSLRLDGKGESYINAAFDMAVMEIEARKDLNYQRFQMSGFGGQRTDGRETSPGAHSARNRMIQRMEKGEKR